MSSNLNEERVLSAHHWTEDLFSFRTTRSPSFRFINGQFTMIGLSVDGRPLLRAYSMASANYEETLEFFSIKVPDGPLTSRLRHLQEGDRIFVSRKATGTLIQHNLLPGRRLFLLSTGTGLAPFLSIIKDPDIYENFEQVILVHGCRRTDELAYGDTIKSVLPMDEVLGEEIRNKLVYYPTVTREPFRNMGRIPDLIASGRLFDDLKMPPLILEDDRIMLCGGPGMIEDISKLLQAKDFCEGSMSEPGHFVIEKAFVER